MTLPQAFRQAQAGAGMMRGLFRRPAAVEEPVAPRSFDDYDLRLGDLMRGERATLGKSLLDVQRELKIKAAYIAAIENADPTAFETQGFVAGYVRSYARYLGMDPEWAYGKFCEEGRFTVPHGMSAAAAPARAQRGPRPQPDGPRDIFSNPATPFAPGSRALGSRIEPGALGSIAVLLVLILGLGYGGWLVLNEIQKVQFAPVEQAPGVVADIADMALPGVAVAAAGEGSAIAPPSADALDRLYRPQALDVPVLVARDGPIAALEPRRGAAAAGGLQGQIDSAVALALGGEAAGELPQVVAANPAEVVMFAVRPAWVRVSAADGTVLFEKILDSGESYTLPQTERPPVLRAGNAGSVYFRVGGAQTYGPAGKPGGVVKNVALSAEAVAGAYSVADLSADSDLAEYVNVAQNNAGQGAPATPAE